MSQLTYIHRYIYIYRQIDIYIYIQIHTIDTMHIWTNGSNCTCSQSPLARESLPPGAAWMGRCSLSPWDTSRGGQGWQCWWACFLWPVIWDWTTIMRLGSGKCKRLVQVCLSKGFEPACKHMNKPFTVHPFWGYCSKMFMYKLVNFMLEL